MKQCLRCDTEIEMDDNFCPKCGHWTAKGYFFLQNNENHKIINGKIVKKQNRISSLFVLMFIFVILVFGMCIYREKEILAPFVYIKRQVMNYQYGYNTTILKTDNQYLNENIPNLETAIEKINSDFSTQNWECKNNVEIGKIEKKLQDDNDIINVSFCDMDIKEAEKVSNVINDIFQLFPNIKGYLTNISISNDKNKNNYVASFQPIYQFVNSINNIDEYNKVNKTQILLNSYYFLNANTLKTPVKENWYVKDASWESLIAHELGHYINYVTLLKEMKIDNVIFVTQENENRINEMIEIINNQEYSKQLVNTALTNYNIKYNTNLNNEEFISLISNYASTKNSQGEYIYDEVIAESVHDYYLHGPGSSKSSLEIINILNEKLN